MPDEIAREDLCRSVSFRVGTDDESGDGFTLDGYATVYDDPTRIDSWEGVFDEEFAFGAFARSIRAKLPKMQFDHGQHPLLGSLPLGRWESVTEEKEGLHTIGRMSDNWLVEPFRQAVAEQAVDGMSIRFHVVREDWMDPDGKKVKPEDVRNLLDGSNGVLRRVIREAKISEAGPVVWPAYQQTSVGVRSKVTIDLARLTDPDQQKTLARAVFLTDAATSTDGPQVTEGAPDNHSAEADPVATAPEPDQHPSAEATARHERMKKRAQLIRGYLLDIDKD